MATSPETWTVKDLVAAVQKDEGEARVIELPRFQRSLEWTDDQRASFITSLIRGYPIGAPILYQDADATRRNGKTTYLLVDGLQRLSTLVWYQEAQLGRLSLDAVPDHELNMLRDAVRSATKPKSPEDARTDEVLVSWLKVLQVVGPEFDGSALIDFLHDKLGCPSTDQVKVACRAIVGKIRELVDVSTRPIPILVYTGDRQSLPIVFKELNRGGTQLSQYDILNAMWTADWTQVRRPQIVKAINERYGLVEDAGFSVEERPDDRYNLYEYILGLGKYAFDGTVIRGVDLLVSNRKRDDQADALAFAVAGVVHGYRPSLLGGLPDAMRQASGGQDIDPRGFERAFLRALKWVIDVLKPYIGLDFKGSRGATPHTDFQIASFIARAIVGMYEPPDWEERQSWKQEQGRLARQIPRHYLLDVLRREWAGSGDSRLFNVVWDRRDDDDLWPDWMPSSYYLQPIRDEAVASALQVYFEDSLRRLDTKRKGATPTDRLILKLAYQNRLSAKAYAEPFEIEHLFPVSLLRKELEKDPSHQGGWPINSVANLAILDKKTNREKSTLTLGEHVGKNTGDRERLTQFALVDVDRIKFNEHDGHAHWEQYLRFLGDNAEAMTQAVLESLP